ncbi:hypothetical protein PTTG_09195 [Puccinia triticina 1-1 BBBD Race 1]|uniref:Myb_DNA-bind_3 domain-containing protein n=1 Tax=Puccinia triticina (isolate 1-1 / race 1 (BBBD)) TaxID=630390 RepID=A0A180GXR0_PUCT1|nr:hypothetical protein PTTG_09195 [Puccinia triticina 1-1 BBBD Race 1]
MELIATQYAAGKQTNNGGLKKEAWPVVVKKLNKKLGTNLTGDQCRNQKNALQKLFFDFKFLQDQSGFGWDEELQTVTADEKFWAKLLETHPQREFFKLMLSGACCYCDTQYPRKLGPVLQQRLIGRSSGGHSSSILPLDCRRLCVPSW